MRDVLQFPCHQPMHGNAMEGIMDVKMLALAAKVRLEMVKNGVASNPENIEQVCATIVEQLSARGFELPSSFKNRLMAAVMALSV